MASLEKWTISNIDKFTKMIQNVVIASKTMIKSTIYQSKDDNCCITYAA